MGKSEQHIIWFKESMYFSQFTSSLTLLIAISMWWKPYISFWKKYEYNSFSLGKISEGATFIFEFLDLFNVEWDAKQLRLAYEYEISIIFLENSHPDF